MNYLTVQDLIFILGDLLTTESFSTKAPFSEAFPNRQAFVRISPLGVPYLNILTTKREALMGSVNKNLDEVTSGLLTQIDQLHDGIGGAIFMQTEVVLRHPRMTEAMKAAATRARNSVIPRLGVLRMSFADEAATAQNLQAKLGDLEADLKLLVVPHPERPSEHQTLYDWVVDFIDQGKQLGTLLSKKAVDGSKELKEYSESASKLRGELIKTLGELRKAIVLNVSSDPSLPRNLETLVFGLVDEQSKRRERASSLTATTPSDVVTPADPGAPADPTGR